MPEMTDILTDLENLQSPRPGLRPLPVHINMALADYLAKAQPDDPILADMAAMVTGIQSYLRHPYRRKKPDHETVWQLGEASLLYFPVDSAPDMPPLLLVPSLINRSHILDLIEEKSFIRWLNRQGCPVYLLDWGIPVQDAGMATLDSLTDSRLLPAMSFIGRREGAFHALGYCMGGTLLALAAGTDEAANLRSMVFLASPWDFHAGDRLLASHIQAGTQAALQMIEAQNILPSNWIQTVFAQINADKTVQKFAGFAALAQDSERAKLFVAVEDWLNEGVDLPGGLARTCLLYWYGQNRPVSGDIAKKLQSLDVPALVVTSAQDRLVPKESALALADHITDVDILSPTIGHIGMMVGRRAEQDVWVPVKDWILSK